LLLQPTVCACPVVCVSVCLCVCLCVCPRAYLRNYTSNLHQFCTCHRRPWLGSPLAVLRYVMPYLFYGSRDVCTELPRIGDAKRAAYCSQSDSTGAARICHRGVFSNLPSGAASDRVRSLITSTIRLPCFVVTSATLCERGY